MMAKTNKKWVSMSDSAIVAALGAFIKHNRLEQNKTQRLLAEEAGINRSTLVQFEKGAHANTITFIQLLRALNLLHLLASFEATLQISPIQLAKMQQAKRKRAGKIKKVIKKQKSDW